MLSSAAICEGYIHRCTDVVGFEVFVDVDIVRILILQEI
jgi:hypothetical protein